MPLIGGGDVKEGISFVIRNLEDIQCCKSVDESILVLGGLRTLGENVECVAFVQRTFG
jgi:hypothetical protein